jgi:septation ring formation regulator EzrA
MLLENKNYRESGYIGEELLGGIREELQQKCMAVQQSIQDDDFNTYEEALSAYGVSDLEYKEFQAKSALQNIFTSFSVTDEHLMNKIYLQIFEKMFIGAFPHQGSHVQNIVKELEQMSIEMEHQK